MMGLVFFFTGLGELIGPIICGWLLDEFQSYYPIIYFTVACYSLASCAMTLVNHYTRRRLALESVPDTTILVESL